MDYNTLIVCVGLLTTGALLGGMGALISLRGENLSADVASHGVIVGVVVAQALATWLGVQALAVALVWVFGSLTAGLTLLFIFWCRQRGYSAGVSQALAISSAYGLTLVLISLAQSTGAFSTKGLFDLLLGNAASLTLAKVIPGLVLLVVGIALFARFQRTLQLFIIDPESAQLSGHARWLNRLWIASTVAVVLVSLPSLGLIVLVGVLSLPALTVRPFVSGFSALVLWSSLVGGVVAMSAGWVSADLLPLPTGALVVVSLGVVWVLSSAVSWGVKRIA